MMSPESSSDMINPNNIEEEATTTTTAEDKASANDTGQMEEEVVINLKNKSKLMMDNVDYERVEQMVYALFSVV